MRIHHVGYTALVEGRFPGNASAVATANQLSTTLGDEVVILGLRDSVYYGLSKVGVRIWELLQKPRTLDDIAAVLVAEYDVTLDQARADLQDLLGDLQARGLVAITPADGA
jgi:Coenzyme PQQ synthesis protein D (PqqD)